MKSIDTSNMEKYSSACTLSDMEMFIFPELLYSLVLANIMSPRLWAWRDDPWFSKIGKMSHYRRAVRLKQYIIDHYEFNLDLETWGLTTQERELERFEPWVDAQTLSASNALFGYEGDKYYFDLDIRRHFGLDKYSGSTIPYWKTETLEAMDAFRYKKGYQQGAGECVSLATLYAAALFVVCGIPLEDIYLMATPLHSQNYIDLGEGLLTNNRRIVTRNMWFNGTELTAKAQRALRNERVTMVCHHSGYIHTLYPEATMRPSAFKHFRERLSSFLTSDIDMEIVSNFLRQHRELQSCFQLEHDSHGRKRYLALECAYHYEHAGAYRVNSDTRDKLLNEIDEYEFYSEPIEGRIPLNKLKAFFENHRVDFNDDDAMERLGGQFDCKHNRAHEILSKLIDFVHVQPRLPEEDKQFISSPSIELNTEMSREDMVAHIEELRGSLVTADLAFYAFRDLERTEWRPFVKAAIERNPVCAERCRNLSPDAVIETLHAMPNESIYSDNRAAQPDEVWNYGRGDGFEKALCLASVLHQRDPKIKLRLTVAGGRVQLAAGGEATNWDTSMSVEGDIDF